MVVFRTLTREEAAVYDGIACPACGHATLPVYSPDGPHQWGRYCPSCGREEKRTLEVITVERPEPNGHAHEADEWLSTAEAAALIGATSGKSLGVYVFKGWLRRRDGDHERLYHRGDLEKIRAKRQGQRSTALVPVTPVKPIPVLPPADPLGLLLAEYREAAAKLAVARHDHEEAVRRERELAEEVNTWDCEVRLLRERLDKGLDEVLG